MNKYTQILFDYIVKEDLTNVAETLLLWEPLERPGALQQYIERDVFSWGGHPLAELLVDHWFYEVDWDTLAEEIMNYYYN